MHIAVIGSEIGDQTRAYAEYRVFSRLTRFSHALTGASVALTRVVADGSATCTLTAHLTDGNRTQVRARARHAHDAIDRATDRLSMMLSSCNQHYGTQPLLAAAGSK